MNRLVVPALILLLIGGCGEDEARPVGPVTPPPPRPRAAGPGLVEPAPGWVSSFCASVPDGMLCPSKTPPELEPSAAGVGRPGRDGYLLEGRGGRDWAVRVVPARVGLRELRPLAPRGRTRVRGRPARWSAAGGGVLGGFLVLSWTEGGRTYAVGGRGDDARLRRQLRLVAAGMRRG